MWLWYNKKVATGHVHQVTIMRHVLVSDPTVLKAYLDHRTFGPLIRRLQTYTDKHGGQTPDHLLLATSRPSNKVAVRKQISALVTYKVLIPEITEVK